jgi:peptide/nickel transport system substrate-binding protein
MLRRTILKGLAAGVAAGALMHADIASAQGARTLTVGIVSDPVTLDPALMASFFELSVQYDSWCLCILFSAQDTHLNLFAIG